MLSFSESQSRTLAAIADTFVAPLNASEEILLIQRTLQVPGTAYSRDQIQQFSRTSGTDIQVVRKISEKISSVLSPKQKREFLLVIDLLNYKPSSLLLTGYAKPFCELSRPQRESVLMAWKKSSYATLRQIFNSLVGLCLTESYFDTHTPLVQALDFDGSLSGDGYFRKHSDYQPVDHERLKMLSTKEAHSLGRFDVIVVGSGAGGSVIAAQLAKEGYSVLVVEKGKYFHQEDMMPDDDRFAYMNMFNEGGITPNSTGTVNVLSGATFGGGTAINYLACLKPSGDVRKEWKSMGLSYFGSEQFERDLDKVSDRIGVSTENIQHNGPNQKLKEGCTKLGYSVKTVPQNTSGKAHHCGKCYTGCSSGIKNSATNTWLKDAAVYGAKYLDCTRVSSILHKRGKAAGIVCYIHGSQVPHSIYSKVVVVAGGALHTPSLLIQSGIKNKHIGKHLRLHLASLSIGVYDEFVYPTRGTLLTQVCDQFDKDFKIECFSNGLGLFSAMIPWSGAAKHKEAMMRYQNSVVTFALIRDKDSDCSVRYDSYGKIDVQCSLSKNDSNNLVNGIIEMAKIHVAAGARQFHVSQHPADSFYFNSDEESSIDNPRFIQWLDYVRRLGPPTPSSGHQMGSCRMGTSPKNSAVKPTGESWDVRNLYVADSSVFPSALGVNPMLTIQAISLSIARNILHRSHDLNSSSSSSSSL